MAREIMALQSSKDEERPMSPFYVSAHASQASSVPAASGEYLERTIRSAVEQHLFDVNGAGCHSSEDSESGTSTASCMLSARQRRRHLKEQDEVWRNTDVEVINKENIRSGFSSHEDCILSAQEAEKLQENGSGYIPEQQNKPKRQKSSTKLSELNDNKDNPLSMETHSSPRTMDRVGSDGMEVLSEDRKDSDHEPLYLKRLQVKSMKIEEPHGGAETRQQVGQEANADNFVREVPRLDLTSLTEETSRWEEPVPAFSSWQGESPDASEARLSPQAGRLIQQLLDNDHDPMPSPRFYAYGHSQQFLDDTEVPPSPPNSHSFMRRRRSSSLGSCDEGNEDLSAAQLTRKIQGLKKKIRKFEDRFEEERKYRPSHGDKAANSEVLKWMNELSKFRKQMKDSKLKISEEDIVPQVRQRSNTLPKSFFSQLDEDKKQEAVDKATKPTVEATLETIQKKLQEKRADVNRSDDIKDMTRDEIASEKVSLQKALLYYESIHGRPVTKIERQVMKPIYDRYRLVKQILYRASTIPVIGSPTSKRRSPLLQPIIEGETASFFKDEKEEENGSDEDNNVKEEFAVTMKASFNMRSFLDQLEDDSDDFMLTTDGKRKSSQDLGLSNLHSASMPELLEQLHEAREEKKKIRKKLRDFEDDFFRQNGRIVLKEDRSPMVEEYSDYKQMKAKMKLLEVLIGKRNASKPV